MSCFILGRDRKSILITFAQSNQDEYHDLIKIHLPHFYVVICIEITLILYMIYHVTLGLLYDMCLEPILYTFIWSHIYYNRGNMYWIQSKQFSHENKFDGIYWKYTNKSKYHCTFLWLWRIMKMVIIYFFIFSYCMKNAGLNPSIFKIFLQWRKINTNYSYA